MAGITERIRKILSKRQHSDAEEADRWNRARRIEKERKEKNLNESRLLIQQIGVLSVFNEINDQYLAGNGVIRVDSKDTEWQESSGGRSSELYHVNSQLTTAEIYWLKNHQGGRQSKHVIKVTTKVNHSDKHIIVQSFKTDPEAETGVSFKDNLFHKSKDPYPKYIPERDVGGKNLKLIERVEITQNAIAEAFMDLERLR